MAWTPPPPPRGRPPIPRRVALPPVPRAWVPAPPHLADPQLSVVILLDELEAMRLVYLEGLTQAEAAERMGVSRATLWRLLSEARRKVTYALVAVKPILVTPVKPEALQHRHRA